MGNDDAPAARAAPPGVRRWVAAFAVCFALSVGIPIGYTTWYVASYARHSCQALELINANRPAHPSAQQVRFYGALQFWADEDGC